MDKYPTNFVWLKLFALTILVAIISGCNNPDDVGKDSGRKMIREIVDVQLSVLESLPRQLEISVSGNVSTSGWTKPTLVPFQYLVPPADGIYEFTFYATPPKETAATVITPIEVTHRLNPLPDDLKGVRIYSETNDIVLMLEAAKPSPVPAIINEITDAQLSIVDGSAGKIAQLEIYAQGTVSTTGWTNPKLIAAEYIAPPTDGIYDFTFYATPPPDISAPAITPIDVRHKLSPIPDYIKGVRIHSATNEIVVMLESPKPEPIPVAINEITDVQLSLLKTSPPQLAINVKGTVNSAGWSQYKLVPYEYVVPPADGIYEFTFYAMPPTEASAEVITPIELTHTLDIIPAGLTGVRIYSATNNIEALLVTDPPKPDPVVINEVTEIKLTIVEGLTRELVIDVDGNVTSAGWSSPVLVPFSYIVAPSDGIYDFTFYATPPSGPSATVISPINVTHRLSPLSDNIKGIRIHSETNQLVAMLDLTPAPPVPAIIYSITGVNLTSPIDFPDQLDISVSGLVNSGGWSQPILIPHEYLVPPTDGIYDFTFYATPPTGPAAGAFGPIELVHRLKVVPADMKGVRIHSQTNSVEVLLDPGTVVNACDFVSGNTFQTAELFEGGLGPPGVDTRFHWSISFATDGTFTHLYSDAGGMGNYYCDDTGFHLVNTIGAPYVPWVVTVDVPGRSVNLPVAEGVDRFYYLVTP